MGGVTMVLLKAHPRLKGVVQDLPEAVNNGKKVNLLNHLISNLKSVPRGFQKLYPMRYPADK